MEGRHLVVRDGVFQSVAGIDNPSSLFTQFQYFQHFNVYAEKVTFVLSVSLNTLLAFGEG